MTVFRKQRRFKNRLAVILAIVFAVLFVIFYLVFYPILSVTVMGRDEYRGKDLYLSETYLKYDSGIDFKNAINTLDLTSNYEVVGFMYYNYPRQDHVIYGKYPDFYVLDLVVGEDFENIYDRYWDESAVYSDYGRYSIKLHQTEKIKSHYNQLYLAFYEKEQILRIIYRTELNRPDE